MPTETERVLNMSDDLRDEELYELESECESDDEYPFICEDCRYVDPESGDYQCVCLSHEDRIEMLEEARLGQSTDAYHVTVEDVFG